MLQRRTGVTPGTTARSRRPAGAALLALLLGGCAAAPPAEPADLVFVGANILTFDPGLPRAGSLAVLGEEIRCVARDASCRALAGPGTRVIELGERALLPGFVDAHGHLTLLAQFIAHANLSSPPVGAVTDIQALVAALRAHLEAQQIPPGSWVLGWGYDDSLLAESRHPTRDDLDAVSRDHPIAVLHVSGHLAVANSAALALAGIDATRPDPPGGRIQRRRDGREPNGVLEETALFGVVGQTPLAAPLEPEALRRALEVYARHGFTTVQDGATSEPGIAALERLGREGGAALDVIMYPMISDPAQPLPAQPLHEYRGRIALGGVKLVLDGSPQGKTAYLTRPYHVPPAGKPPDYRGYPNVDQAFVDAALARFLPSRVPVLAHANGDAAQDMLIAAVERAVERAPGRDHRTVVIHAQTARDDQLDRMRALGMVPSFFSTHTFFWGDWHRDSVLGPERASRISPLRSALARQLPFTIHNDAPVVPPDAIRLLWASVNRITRSGVVLGPEQRISTQEALRALTASGAYQYFEERRKGSLGAGRQADLVVLSRDPLALEPERLLELRVEETISRGHSVYRRGAAPG